MSKAKNAGLGVLKNSDGADRIGYGDQTANQALAGRLESVDSVAEMAALKPQRSPKVVLQGERAGVFVFEDSDLSAEVTADSLQGFYVAPDSDATGASGAFVRQPGSELPNPAWFGGKVNGTLSDAALSACVGMFPGRRIALNDGEHNYSAFPAGIDGVRFEGSSRITWTDVALPIFNGLFTGNMETVLVAGVIRYYDVRPGDGQPGWAFLKAAGDNHDPIMLDGPINQPGAGSNLTVDVLLDAYGLDPALWTPAGFISAPDEDLASFGINMGASVGTESITTRSYFSHAPQINVSYDEGAGEFDPSSGAYTFEWLNPGGATNARMRMTKASSNAFKAGTSAFEQPQIDMRALNAAGSNTLIHSRLVGRVTNGSGPYDIGAQYDVVFFDAAGNRITNPSADMKFTVRDVSLKNREVDIQNWENEFGNIWLFGAFVRKPGTL